MIKKIDQTINKYALLDKGDSIVVALSGGADSCALLMSLVSLSKALDLTIIVAHFNHGLRGTESDGDEAFCRQLAQAFDLPFIAEKVDGPSVPQGVSPEDYWRRERYRFLDKIAAANGAKKIALGHHASDQAETVLINILRGSGLDGLKGFLPIRDNKYIRPLIEVSREEIKDFLDRNGSAYRQDSSNSDESYLRNRIRRELIPFLREKYNPQIEENLARMARIVRRDDEFIHDHVRAILSSSHIQDEGNKKYFAIAYFKSLPAALRFRLIKALLESFVPGGKGFSAAHIQSLVRLAFTHASGKELSLPYDLHARREYDHIIIQHGPRLTPKPYEYPLTIPGTVALEERHLILSTGRTTMAPIDFNRPSRTYFDGDKIKEPLVVRNRMSGDWFRPLGSPGSQKIKKLFIDRKIPRPQRDSLALIADQESVIWIENMHLCDRVKVTSGTKNVVVLDIRSLPWGGGPA